MTKLGEEIKLNTESCKDYFDFPVSQTNDGFLINSSRNSISILQLHNHKVVLMWTLRQPRFFTSSLVYNSTKNTIHCVVNEKSIYSWNLDCEDLKAAIKVKTKNKVFCLLCIEGTVLVVFRTGEVSKFEEVTAELHSLGKMKEVVRTDEELLWADVTLNQDKDIIVVQLVHSKKSSEYRMQTLNSKTGDFNRTEIKIEGVSLKSWCLCGYMEFLTIWSNGDVCAYNLEQTTEKYLFTLANVDQECGISADCLSKSHLAVAKFGNSKRNVLEIWDIKFAARKAQVTLKNSVCNNLKMKAFPSSIFLSCDDSVSMLPVSLDTASLSAVVGKATCPPEMEMEIEYKWEKGELIVKNCMSKPCEKALSLLDSNVTATLLFEEMIPNLAIGEREEFLSNLSKLKSVPEIEIVRMLQFALRNIAKVPMAMENISEDSQQILNAIFKISFTDIFLGQNLGLLTYEEVMKALVYLLELFNSQIFSSESSQVPTDKQVVDWMQLLLQSHFQEITLSSDPNVFSFLKQLKLSLSEKMTVYTDFEFVEHLCMVHRKKNILPERNAFTNYCIESLHL